VWGYRCDFQGIVYGVSVVVFQVIVCWETCVDL